MKGENMNHVILTGRLTGDPKININGDNKFARYTLATDRKVRRDPDNPKQQTADFISCVAFGKGADFVDRYLRKGIKIAITGHLQTGKYTNKEGHTIYSTDVVVEDHEFCESKSSGQSGYESSSQSHQTQAASMQQPSQTDIPFINIPENISAEVPFE